VGVHYTTSQMSLPLSSSVKVIAIDLISSLARIFTEVAS
jgi:hypothetical protein